jgi:hypothetical protein
MSRRSSNNVESKTKNLKINTKETKMNSENKNSNPISKEEMSSPKPASTYKNPRNSSKSQSAPQSPTNISPQVSPLAADETPPSDLKPLPLTRQVAHLAPEMSMFFHPESKSFLDFDYAGEIGVHVYKLMHAAAFKIWKNKKQKKIAQLTTDDNVLIDVSLSDFFNRIYNAERAYLEEVHIPYYGQWVHDKRSMMSYNIESEDLLRMFQSENLLKLVQAYVFFLTDIHQWFTSEPFIHPLQLALDDFYTLRRTQKQMRFGSSYPMVFPPGRNAFPNFQPFAAQQMHPSFVRAGFNNFAVKSESSIVPGLPSQSKRARPEKETCPGDCAEGSTTH